jgi:N-acetylmuramoyl-L-alanine amidase
MDIGADTIREWHQEKGWIDIGYHYVIRRNGIIEPGRPQWAVGAHVENHNSNSVALCMVGGVSQADANKAENNFTDEQWNALLSKVRALHGDYPAAKVGGHRSFAGVHKDCPSFDAIKWAEDNGFPAMTAGT